jgi:hypothetical protein
MSEIRVGMIGFGVFIILILIFGVSWISAFGHTCFFVGELNFSKPNCIPGAVIGFGWVLGIGLIVSAFVFKEQLDKIVATAAGNMATTSAPKEESQVAATASYDRDKWGALLKYDEDVAKVAEVLRPLGAQWMDEFARSYLALNDKKYLESIAKKIMSDFQAEQGRVAVAPKIGDR